MSVATISTSRIYLLGKAETEITDQPSSLKRSDKISPCVVVQPGLRPIIGPTKQRRSRESVISLVQTSEVIPCKDLRLRISSILHRFKREESELYSISSRSQRRLRG